MRNIFKESRIRFNELLQDAQIYLEEAYSQNKKVFTPASPFGQILSVIVGLAQKIFFYIEDSITELNIYTASRESSIYGLASLVGYNPQTAKSATGTVKILYNGKLADDPTATNLIILNQTKCFCKLNNLPYLIYTNGSELRFNLNGTLKSVEAKLVQGELREYTFTGTGQDLQSYRINEGNPEFIDREYIEVFINDNKCKIYESLYDIPLGEYGCIVKLGVSNGLDIFFGTFYNGFVPVNGSIIKVRFVRNAGYYGNIIDAQNVKFTIVENGYDNLGNEISLNDYIELEMTTNLSFGSNPEDVDVTRLLAPKQSRAFVLSNTDAYDTYFRKMNYFSTVEVFNTFDDDNLQDDNVVYCFLIPNLRYRIAPTLDYFTAPIGAFLLSSEEQSDLYTKVEESGQQMIGTQLNILNPNIKRFVLFVIINHIKGYSKELIREDVIRKMSNYFINFTRRDRIPKSDLVAILENVSGVDSVNVYFKADANNSLGGLTSYIDSMGDIIIGKNDYVIIRGGWVDSDTNTSYYEGLAESTQCSLNVIFNEEVEPTNNRRINKSIVDSIRNVG